MNFTCSKEELSKAVSIASRAVSRIESNNILECILFECYDDTLTLKATDFALSVEIKIPAEIWEEGSAAVVSRSLYDIISKFPNADVAFKKVSNSKIEMTCLSSKVTLSVIDEKDFPDIPKPEDPIQIKLPQKVFRNMIDTTIFAAAINEDKPILTGLHFDAEPGFLTLVGLDGYRMAVRKSVAVSEMSRACTVPARALKETARFVADTEENLKIIIGDSLIVFEWKGIKISARLLEGNYVNYKKLIPQEFSTIVTADTDAVKNAIERAQVLARDGNNVVTLSISDKIMNITSKSELGEIDEDVFIQNEGQNIKIGFNTKYILDVLKNISDEETEFRFNTPISPCVVKKDGEQSYTYMILPVQLRD